MLVNLSNQIGSILLITVYIGGLLLIAEILNRLHKTDSELTRKIVHIGTGNVILLAWWLNITSDVILLAVITASIVAIASYYLPILPSVNSVGRHSLGTLFYAISIGILTALFWHEGEKQFTAIGILIMSYGDGMAALIGQKWGKHKYQLLGNKKKLGRFINHDISEYLSSYFNLRNSCYNTDKTIHYRLTHWNLCYNFRNFFLFWH